MSNVRALNLKNNKDLSFKDRKRLSWKKEKKLARQQSLEVGSRRNLDEWDLMGDYFQTDSSIVHQTHLNSFLTIIEGNSPSSPPPQLLNSSPQPSTSSTPESKHYDTIDSIPSWSHCDDGRDFEMMEQPTLLPPI